MTDMNQIHKNEWKKHQFTNDMSRTRMIYLASWTCLPRVHSLNRMEVIPIILGNIKNTLNKTIAHGTVNPGQWQFWDGIKL